MSNLFVNTDKFINNNENQIDNTFFDDQYQDIEEDMNSKIKKKNYVKIDSRFRNKIDKINSKKISTRKDFILSLDHSLYLIITDPSQLEVKTNKDVELKYFIITKNHNEEHQEYIAGLHNSRLIYNLQTGKPILKSKFYKYDEDSDEVWYKILNVESNIDGTFGSIYTLRHIKDIIKGYPNSNYYKVRFNTVYRNVSAIRIISSEFKIPEFLPTNGKLENLQGEIIIPNKNIERSITIKKGIYNKSEDLTNELLKSISKVLIENKNLQPVTLDKNSIGLAIANYIITDDNITSYRKLNANNLVLGIAKYHNLSDEDIIIINSKKYNLSGYFRIDFDNYCILLQIKNESDNNISEKELSTIYQDNFPIGNLLSIFVKDENTYLLITTQMPLIFKKGNRLNSLDQKLIFTILDYTILGNSNLLYLQKINDLLDTTNDLKYGIFKLEKFKLTFDNMSIISYLNFKTPEIISKIKYTNDKIYEIDAKYRSNENSKLIFRKTDIPVDMDQFQITHMYNNNFRKIHIPSTKIHRVILSEVIENNDIILYLDTSDCQFTIGKWIKVYRKYDKPLYLKIKDIPDSENKITLILDSSSINYNSPIKPILEEISKIDKKHLHELEEIIDLDELDELKNDNTNTKNAIDDIILVESNLKDVNIKRGYPLDEVTTILIDDVLRNTRKIQVLSHTNFTKNFIINIGNDHYDDCTISELNIITNIVKDKDKTTLYLKYPIVNSRLKGTKITQNYFYLNVIGPINEKCEEIVVYSLLDLTKLKKCRFSINWLSKYLTTNTEDDHFSYEETNIIRDVKYQGDDLYILHTNHPIRNYYLENEAYLVLFVNYDLSRADPPTLNYNIDNTWYTGFSISNPEDYNFSKMVNIRGMTTENIPIFGLSSSDTAMRNINRLDVESDMVHNFKLLSNPNYNEILDILEDPPDFYRNFDRDENFIVVKGRYWGRNGIISPHNKEYEDKLDCKLLGMQSNYNIYDDIITYNFSPNLLPNITRDIDETDVKIGVKSVAHDTEIIKISKPNYFYICTTITNTIKTVKDNLNDNVGLEGWSFLKNDNAEDKLIQHSKIFSKHNMLNHIFSSFQLEHDAENTLFNAHLPIESDFNDCPLKELVELEICFLWPNGELVDFLDNDHSFTLEIVENEGVLKSINSRTGNKI